MNILAKVNSKITTEKQAEKARVEKRRHELRWEKEREDTVRAGVTKILKTLQGQPLGKMGTLSVEFKDDFEFANVYLKGKKAKEKQWLLTFSYTTWKESGPYESTLDFDCYGVRISFKNLGRDFNTAEDSGNYSWDNDGWDEKTKPGDYISEKIADYLASVVKKGWV